MSALAQAVLRAPREAESALAVADVDLADRPHLRQALRAAGLRLVVAEALSVERALLSAGPGAAVLVLVGTGTLQGVRLKERIESRVERFRRLAPHAGVLVVADRPCNPSLLPSRTWLVPGHGRPIDLRPMVEAVRAAVADRVEVRRRWPEAPSGTGARPGRRPSPPARCVPNFNVRHPAMLVPIARVAAGLGTPVFCEISPQEALKFRRGGRAGGDPQAVVRTALTELRGHVDAVRAATGCEMWLHLDHCDDPGLIAHALDVGFDSIMADGSDRPLHLNLAFTRHAVQLAARYGVPVEGEVGAIDPGGRRRTSRTELADVATYVRGTGVACLGVNVGQVHGSDYEYNRARRAIREIRDLDRLQRGGGAWALYEACSDLEAELAERGVARAHDDRRRLHALRDCLVDEPGAAAEDVLATAYEGADVAFCGLLARLEQGWHRRRTRMAARKRKLYGQVAGPDVGWSDGPSHRRFLDLHLLRGVSEVIEELGARVVLHGGSSIAFDDLRLLDRMGVARVNFGSAPFAAFLGALSARSPEGRPPDRPATLPEILRFLDEHAADWPGWLEGGGPEMEAFEEQLRRRYFLPLATTGGVHA